MHYHEAILMDFLFGIIRTFEYYDKYYKQVQPSAVLAAH